MIFEKNDQLVKNLIKRISMLSKDEKILNNNRFNQAKTYSDKLVNLCSLFQ